MGVAYFTLGIENTHITMNTSLVALITLARKHAPLLLACMVGLTAFALYAQHQTNMYTISKVQLYFTPPVADQPGKLVLKNAEPEKIEFQLSCQVDSFTYKLGKYEPQYVEMISLPPNHLHEIAVLLPDSKRAPSAIVQGHFCVAAIPWPVGIKRLVWGLRWKDGVPFKGEV